MIFSFFFFQAEDGIRDYKVTGVQTCALPISDAYPPRPFVTSHSRRSAEARSPQISRPKLTTGRAGALGSRPGIARTAVCSVLNDDPPVRSRSFAITPRRPAAPKPARGARGGDRRSGARWR